MLLQPLCTCRHNPGQLDNHPTSVCTIGLINCYIALINLPLYYTITFLQANLHTIMPIKASLYIHFLCLLCLERCSLWNSGLNSVALHVQAIKQSCGKYCGSPSGVWTLECVSESESGKRCSLPTEVVVLNELLEKADQKERMTSLWSLG